MIKIRSLWFCIIYLQQKIQNWKCWKLIVEMSDNMAPILVHKLLENTFLWLIVSHPVLSGCPRLTPEPVYANGSSTSSPISRSPSPVRLPLSSVSLAPPSSLAPPLSLTSLIMIGMWWWWWCLGLILGHAFGERFLFLVGRKLKYYDTNIKH